MGAAHACAYEEQRAALCGFVPKGSVGAFQKLVRRYPEFKLIVFRPGHRAKDSRTYISNRQGKGVTSIGYCHSRRDLAFWYDGLHPEMIRVLQDSYQVQLYDTEWGRNTLWLALRTLW